MAGGTIAKLNVLLTASVGGFASSMASAAQPLASFGSNVLSTSAKIGGLVGAITGLVGAGSLSLLVHQSMEAIDATAKLADRMGTSTEAMVGLKFAAKLAAVDQETLTTSLTKMQKALNGAAEDGSSTSATFAQLGLDAKELANLPADQAFTQIAEKLSHIENASQRAGIEMQIFGRGGAALDPLLTRGAAGIAAAADEAQRLGLTFNRVDAAKVEAANEAIVKVQGAIEGVGNQLAIQLAPFIAEAANRLVGLATSGDGMATRVVAGFEAVVTATAYASDYLQLGVAGFKLLQAGGTLAVLGLVKSIDLIGAGVVKVLNLLPGVSIQWTGFFNQMSTGLIQDVNRLTSEAGTAFQTFQRGDNSKAVGRFFDDIRAKSQKSAEAVAAHAQKMGGAFQELEDHTANLKKVAETLAELQKQVDQFGLTDAQKKSADLSALGASPEQLAQAKKLADQLDSMNAAKKKQDDMASKAKEVFDSTRTPMEKYESKIGELGDLLNSGKLDWDTYGRAVRQARGELEKSTETPNLAAPDLFKAGSAAAAKFTYDAARGSKSLGRDDIPKKALVEATESSRLLDRIEKNTRPDATATVDI
jgi:hypothetical protein